MKSDALVEHVDLYPTLVEAAGLAVPPTCPEEEPFSIDYCTEGKSLLSLLTAPGMVVDFISPHYEYYSHV